MTSKPKSVKKLKSETGSPQENHFTFTRVLPKIVEVLVPILVTATEKGIIKEDPTPEEAGVLVGHILSSIDIVKIDQMMTEAEKW
jgi:hypothetical protein